MLDIFSYSIATLYFLVILIFTFTTFIMKREFTYSSLFFFSGILANFVIMLSYILDAIFLFRNFTISAMIILIGFFGNLSIFLGSVRVQRAINTTLNPLYIKLLNFLCIIINIFFIDYFVFLFLNPTSTKMISAFIFEDIRIIRLYYLTAIYYYVLTIIHLPKIAEYRYIRISFMILIINFVIRYFYIYNIFIYLTYTLFLITSFLPIKNLYVKAIKYNRKAETKE